MRMTTYQPVGNPAASGVPLCPLFSVLENQQLMLQNQKQMLPRTRLSACSPLRVCPVCGICAAMYYMRRASAQLLRALKRLLLSLLQSEFA